MPANRAGNPLPAHTAKKGYPRACNISISWTPSFSIWTALFIDFHIAEHRSIPVDPLRARGRPQRRNARRFTARSTKRALGCLRCARGNYQRSAADKAVRSLFFPGRTSSRRRHRRGAQDRCHLPDIARSQHRAPQGRFGFGTVAPRTAAAAHSRPTGSIGPRWPNSKSRSCRLFFPWVAAFRNHRQAKNPTAHSSTRQWNCAAAPIPRGF